MDHRCLIVGKRAEVGDLLGRLTLRHPEKVTKKGIGDLLARSDWNEGWFEAKRFNRGIKEDVLILRKAAEKELAKRHPEEDWTTRAT